jgi:hypothetical protein
MDQLADKLLVVDERTPAVGALVYATVLVTLVSGAEFGSLRRAQARAAL